MKKYIIFDLDWTLIHSQKSINNTIIEYIEKNFEEDYIDPTRYFLHNQKWATLKYLFEYLWIYWNENKYHEKKLFNEIKKIENLNFIDWTIKKIKQLYDNWYILFLSTWNSTDFAENILEKWWIKDLFKKIMWSEIVPKSNEHIEIFKDEVLDKDFFKKSLSIWDWQKEEEIANYYWIEFIKIWIKYKSIEQINFQKY